MEQKNTNECPLGPTSCKSSGIVLICCKDHVYFVAFLISHFKFSTTKWHTACCCDTYLHASKINDLLPADYYYYGRTSCSIPRRRKIKNSLSSD
jgi:hypothetical protein